MRPKQDAENSGDVLSEIESILLNIEFRSDLKCLNSKDYGKLWHEYAVSVCDCDLVYKYIFEEIQI